MKPFKTARLMMLIVSVLACSACGQKGPLIAPQKQENYKKLNF